MALGTGGTNAGTSLGSIIFSRQMTPANIALINNGIKGQNAVQTLKPGAFSQTGRIYLPGDRGILIAQPGDYIMLDATSGWPILVSAYAIATGPWAHSP